ncbi:MAG: DnaJ domain-containing protein [Armatimonadetes bacterium]|nr:DnaJ domain-containing protein [Armatimonadota bacterium]
MPKDPYATLGVSPLSSLDEIKRAFRNLAKLHHPDQNPDAPMAAAERMRQINEAYQVVSDPSARKAYDAKPELQWRQLKTGASSKGTTGRPGPSILDKLGNLFKKQPAQSDLKTVEYHFSLATTYAQSTLPASWGHAIKEFGKALILDPDCREALYNQGLMFYRSGNFNEAWIVFKKLAAKNPGDRDVVQMEIQLRPGDLGSDFGSQ